MYMNVVSNIAEYTQHSKNNKMVAEAEFSTSLIPNSAIGHDLN
jgi:hypothetical protein